MTDTTPMTNQQIAEELKPLADTIRNAIETRFILGDPLDYLVAGITVAVAAQMGGLVREDMHRPRRGDAVETWLKAQRDAAADHPAAWEATDGLLDLYRLHADTGTPLDQHACENGNVDDCHGCYEAAKAEQQ